MATDIELPDYLRFVQLLWELDHALNKRSRWMLKHLGITAEQRFMIHLVGLRPGCTPGEVARALRVTPATVTRAVRRLELAGYVSRQGDATDSRKVNLFLTGRGRKVEERQEARGEGPVAQVLARSPAARVDETRRLIEDILEALRQPAT
jgi:MarR family transcriptional regulator, organic hydroperoxide resistance regulator